MKTILYSILLLVFCLPVRSYAQATTNYTISSNQVTISEETVAITSTLTKTANSIIWTQSANGTNSNTEFTINQTTGSWDTTTSQGSLTHTFTKTGYTSSLTLTGTQNNLSARLSIQKDGAQIQHYNFNITEITYP